MKHFIHNPLQISIPEIQCITTDDGRYYITPEGKQYASITNVLSILSEDAIENWIQRVGERKARSIADHAAANGTDLHIVLERYLRNQELIFPEDPKSRVRIMFNRMKTTLNDVDNIVLQETALYSDALQIAGRCDCIAEYKGILSIVDFKSTIRAKKKDWIQSYFMQATGYSLMFEERTGIKAEQIVVLMSGETDFSAQVFVEKRDNYIEGLKETIKLFEAS